MRNPPLPPPRHVEANKKFGEGFRAGQPNGAPQKQLTLLAASSICHCRSSYGSANGSTGAACNQALHLLLLLI